MASRAGKAGLAVLFAAAFLSAAKASRAETPVPVGERSTSPSAKTQQLRLWTLSSGEASTKITP